MTGAVLGAGAPAVLAGLPNTPCCQLPTWSLAVTGDLATRLNYCYPALTEDFVIQLPH